jgi:molecular chaperone GrpE
MNELRAESEAASEHALGDGCRRAGRVEQLKAELEVQKTEHAALHDKYIRLYSEFDNFRKRSAKERLELFQVAGAESIKAILPVLGRS